MRQSSGVARSPPDSMPEVGEDTDSVGGERRW